MSPTPCVDRRTLSRRAAAAGLLATPATGLLGGCVRGGDTGTPQQAQGEKTADNPLGVKEDAALEVVIFNGGLGTRYPASTTWGANPADQPPTFGTSRS